MEKDKRAARRLALERMKDRAERVYARDGQPDARDRRLANHIAVCSCYRCGNPRKYYGIVTRQELRAQDVGW